MVTVRLPRAWARSLALIAASHGLPLQSVMRSILEIGLDQAPGELLSPRDATQRRLAAVQDAVRRAIGAEEQIRISAEWAREQRLQTHPGRPQDLRPHRLHPPGQRLAERLRAAADAESILALPASTQLVEPPNAAS